MSPLRQDRGLVLPPFVVRAEGSTVEAWSTERLQWQPRGWQVDLRSRLRAGIASLSGPNGACLAAAYVSADQSLCDAENVLVYNVGISAFSPLGIHRILFERSFLSPLPPPVPLSGEASHYQRYELTQRSGPAFWTVGRPLSSFAASRIVLPVDAAHVWSAVHEGPVRLFGEPTVPTLCLRVTVGLPVASRTSVLTLLKPLLDGVVAAFHAHDGTALVAVSARLGDALDMDPGAVADRLVDDRFNVLGRRRLVRPSPSGVVWNPADDALVAVDVNVRPETESVISGELFEAIPLAGLAPTG